jgi:hypothetical protein
MEETFWFIYCLSALLIQHCPTGLYHLCYFLLTKHVKTVQEISDVLLNNLCNRARKTHLDQSLAFYGEVGVITFCV